MAEQARKKSPRAPSLSLEQAIEVAVKIYDRERLHAVPMDVAAQTLGYKSANNGSVLSLLAALRYFGLLDRPKEGLLSISKKVESYKFVPDEQLKLSLLRDFLLAPPLYRELLEKYESGLPSEANLKYELIQKGFLPQSVDGILSAFLQSVEFARYFANQGEVSSSINLEEQPSEKSNRSRAPSIIEKEAKTFPQIGDLSQVIEMDKTAHDQIPIRLPAGRKAWLIVPNPFYEADKVRIKAQVDLLLSDDQNSDAG